jgi:hypothetical protein
MGGNEQKKTVLFNAQQYPKVIDYIIQTIFQHRYLYEVLLEEKPQEIEKIEENRTVRTHLSLKKNGFSDSFRSIFMFSKNHYFLIH